MSFTSPDGVEREVFHTGEPMRVRISYTAREEQPDPICELDIERHDGVLVASASTRVSGFKLPTMAAGEGWFEWELDSLTLTPGTYYFTPRILERTGMHSYDEHLRWFRIRVHTGTLRERRGVAILPGDMERRRVDRSIASARLHLRTRSVAWSFRAAARGHLERPRSYLDGIHEGTGRGSVTTCHASGAVRRVALVAAQLIPDVPARVVLERRGRQLRVVAANHAGRESGPAAGRHLRHPHRGQPEDVLVGHQVPALERGARAVHRRQADGGTGERAPAGVSHEPWRRRPSRSAERRSTRSSRT